MIKLAGAALSGLDEFTVRLGHLKVIAAVAIDWGGSWNRVEKAVARELTKPVRVPSEHLHEVARYLSEKHLCLGISPSEEPKDSRRQFRYPDLVVTKVGEKYEVSPLTSGDEIAVWWQDYHLADPSLPSHLGAVTTSAKASSKTGLSHVMDWATSLGILSTTGEPTMIGRLVAKLAGDAMSSEWTSNPYRLDADRLVFAHLVFEADFDITSRFLMSLSRATWPIRKREAAAFYAESVNKVIDEADAADYLTNRQRFALVGHYKELDRAARSRRVNPGETSTAWHRTVSRLEAMVDLGILTKTDAENSFKYAYAYYPTKVLGRIVDSLNTGDNAQDWIEERLAECLREAPTLEGKIPLELLREPLMKLLTIVRSPSRVYPIDVLSTGLAALLENTDLPVSFRSSRNSLESLAREHPEIARLARGTTGDRSEYVSIDERRLLSHA